MNKLETGAMIHDFLSKIDNLEKENAEKDLYIKSYKTVSERDYSRLIRTNKSLESENERLKDFVQNLLQTLANI